MNNFHKCLSVILLAGGKGTRMRSPTPKQYLMLKGKPIISYCFELFLQAPEVAEIIIVCEPEYRSSFTYESTDIKLTFALPGERRQDSIYNGLQAMQVNSPFVCTHDGVRPFISLELISRLIKETATHGAATAACPVKFTVKEGNSEKYVNRTLERKNLWEIQTPQMIKTDLFKTGFKHVLDNKLEVTDDVSIVEAISHPVKLVEGLDDNIKITTPHDLMIADQFLELLKR